MLRTTYGTKAWYKKFSYFGSSRLEAFSWVISQFFSSLRSKWGRWEIINYPPKKLLFPRTYMPHQQQPVSRSLLLCFPYYFPVLLSRAGKHLECVYIFSLSRCSPDRMQSIIENMTQKEEKSTGEHCFGRCPPEHYTECSKLFLNLVRFFLLPFWETSGSSFSGRGRTCSPCGSRSQPFFLKKEIFIRILFSYFREYMHLDSPACTFRRTLWSTSWRTWSCTPSRRKCCTAEDEEENRTNGIQKCTSQDCNLVIQFGRGLLFSERKLERIHPSFYSPQEMRKKRENENCEAGGPVFARGKMFLSPRGAKRMGTQIALEKWIFCIACFPSKPSAKNAWMEWRKEGREFVCCYFCNALFSFSLPKKAILIKFLKVHCTWFPARIRRVSFPRWYFLMSFWVLRRELTPFEAYELSQEKENLIPRNTSSGFFQLDFFAMAPSP